MTIQGALTSGDQDATLFGMEGLVRRHDWACTPLGPRTAWPQSLCTTVDNMLSSGHAMCVIWGPERILLYNDGYIPVLGARHPSALGLPTATVWPELWEQIKPLIDRTFAGESCVFRDQPLTMTRNGFEEETWWDFAYSPVRNERGEVAGLLNITSDSTERVLALRQRDVALAEAKASASRLAALVEASSDSLYSMSSNWQQMRYLDGRGFVADTEAPIIHWMDAYLFPEDRAEIKQAIDAAIAGGTPFELEHRVRRADGTPGWTSSRAVPVHDARNRVVEWIGMAADITARHQAEAALRESEAFTRSVLAASTDCIKVIELDGTLSFMSEGGMHTMEVSDFNQVKGCPWPDFFRDDGPDAARAAIEAAKQGRASHFETPANTYLGTDKFWSVSVSPIPDANGQVTRILSVSRDHTELEKSREQQRLLNGELAHRLKNVLAVVSSLAQQTLRTAPDMGAAASSLSARLAALGAATDVLTGASWRSADLNRLAASTLTPHGTIGTRILLDGPPVVLQPQVAVSLSLALHELGTNAVKYGALSNDSGIVHLTWTVEGEDADARFAVRWREMGGPTVAVPTRRGFGSTLIERSLRSYFRRKAATEFRPDGLVFELEARLGDAAVVG